MAVKCVPGCLKKYYSASFLGYPTHDMPPYRITSTGGGGRDTFLAIFTILRCAPATQLALYE